MLWNCRLAVDIVKEQFVGRRLDTLHSHVYGSKRTCSHAKCSYSKNQFRNRFGNPSLTSVWLMLSNQRWNTFNRFEPAVVSLGYVLLAHFTSPLVESRYNSTRLCRCQTCLRAIFPCLFSTLLKHACQQQYQRVSVIVTKPTVFPGSLSCA